MTPRFILPAGYAPRPMQFVLSRERNGWRFYGHADGYAVPARNPAGALLCNGETFATRGEAAIMARALDLPPYAVWNGRKRRYDGTGAVFPAVARDAQEI
jgi:hypothetical protein